MLLIAIKFQNSFLENKQNQKLKISYGHQEWNWSTTQYKLLKHSLYIWDHCNWRFGTKGQGTSLPPCTTEGGVSGGGISLGWGGLTLVLSWWPVGGGLWQCGWHVAGGVASMGVKQTSRCSRNHWSSNTNARLFKGSEVGLNTKQWQWAQAKSNQVFSPEGRIPGNLGIARGFNDEAANHYGRKNECISNMAAKWPVKLCHSGNGKRNSGVSSVSVLGPWVFIGCVSSGELHWNACRLTKVENQSTWVHVFPLGKTHMNAKPHTHTQTKTAKNATCVEQTYHVRKSESNYLEVVWEEKIPLLRPHPWFYPCKCLVRLARYKTRTKAMFDKRPPQLSKKSCLKLALHLFSSSDFPRCSDTWKFALCCFLPAFFQKVLSVSASLVWNGDQIWCICQPLVASLRVAMPLEKSCQLGKAASTYLEAETERERLWEEWETERGERKRERGVFVVSSVFNLTQPFATSIFLRVPRCQIDQQLSLVRQKEGEQGSPNCCISHSWQL